jgi:carboxyl-terminal processing protease
LLEQVLSGTNAVNGLDIEIRSKVSNPNEVYGWVRLVFPNSDASTKNVQRGAVFYAINGTSLTRDNYRSLLSATTYTLNFADYNNGSITPNGVNISFTKTAYNENPIFYTNTYNQGSQKIGYLVYNGFFSDYETQLNNVFTEFKNQNITHLILDMRYNSGGSVNTAIRLASMITGQFSGQVFSKQQWNDKILDANGGANASVFVNRFTNSLGNGTTISSLNLSKVIILTTKSTASASELVINGLKPYIQVVQIGATTSGKNVGSITVYDSEDYTKNNVNPAHKYAMQPIVLRIANAADFADYTTGLVPDVSQTEDLNNVGVIGNTTELLLQTALNYIATNGRRNYDLHSEEKTIISSTKLLTHETSTMYSNDLQIKRK